MGDLFERYARQARGDPRNALLPGQALFPGQRDIYLRPWLEKLTKSQLDTLARDIGTPIIQYDLKKPHMIEQLIRQAKRAGKLEKLAEEAKMRSGERSFERQEKARLYSENLKVLNRHFPEWREVLKAAGGDNPRKFVEDIKVLVTPAPWNPTGLGDFDVRHTYHYDGKTRQLRAGPMYSYDTMLNAARGSGLQTRTVELTPGDRFWDVIYSGQYGGYWHTVRVYISPAQQHQLGGTLLLGGK